MNRWFGEPFPRDNFRADYCADDDRRIPVPVGETCYLCNTTIVETDRGEETYGVGEDLKTAVRLFHHVECIVRTTRGCFELVSTGKVWTRDHVCHGHENYREDALKVWAWVNSHPGALG